LNTDLGDINEVGRSYIKISYDDDITDFEIFEKADL